MKAVNRDVIVIASAVWFLILFVLPSPPAYAQNQIKAAEATSVESLTGGGQKITYLKVSEKEWNQVSRNARNVCQETNRDEWSVYLSCSRPNSNRKITVVLNLFKKEITSTRPNGSVRKFPISKIGAAPDYSKANQDVISVEYGTSASGTTKFLKITDKTWRQGPVAAKLTWKEASRDKSSIYLSRINPNSNQEQKVTLNLQTKEIFIYSRPGFAPTKFSISKINRTPSGGGKNSLTSAETPRQRNIYGQGGSGAFGRHVVALANGNIVVTDPSYDAPGPIVDVGAVYVYRGSTGALQSKITGSKAGDKVGSGGITALANGNFVISSPNWNSGAATNAGAVTWADGATGIGGTVSAANSLIGSTSGGRFGGVIPLPNGNYLVVSPFWQNGSAKSAGAVTFGNGTRGISGVISAQNSLVGSQSGDFVGLPLFFNPITILANGNYLVSSPSWSDGAKSNVGAVTWGSGTNGVVGPVSAANSLIGTTKNDNVGVQGILSGLSVRRLKAVVPLANGNYIVGSPDWDNGAVRDAGAVTWGNGRTGIKGKISAANSLVGSTTKDKVGSTLTTFGLTALKNGNYVVSSGYWNNGAKTNVGAVTWGNGRTGIRGPVSAANSLVGSKAGDQVGSEGVTALISGNYVVSSRKWDNGAIRDAGAVTFGNGSTGIRGPVSAANSLVGSKAADFIGLNGVTALTNGNYVVSSSSWSNGVATNVGAVTWGNGNIGTRGEVSPANSLVGSSTDDLVGSGEVTALTNGNYVVKSSSWNNGKTKNAGAVTWGNGKTGTRGTVSSKNSLVGSRTGDLVGLAGVTALTNGNYVVGSPEWNGDVGAATWGNGKTGTSGPVTPANSLVGSGAGDQVGGAKFQENQAFAGIVRIETILALPNGNYIVGSPNWGGRDVGAITFGNGRTGITGPVSATNSLVGSKANDRIGLSGSKIDKFAFAVTALPNGSYVVNSPSWDNGGKIDAGAVTVANGPLAGPINNSNSVLGLVANGGQSLNFAYVPTNGSIAVGRSAENMVTWMRGTNMRGL